VPPDHVSYILGLKGNDSEIAYEINEAISSAVMYEIERVFQTVFTVSSSTPTHVYSALPSLHLSRN